MLNHFVIDGYTYKIMKYAYKKHSVKIGAITRKFGPKSSIPIMELCRMRYGTYISPSGEVVEIPDSLHESGTFYLLPIGNKYIEDRTDDFRKWILPISISFLSVVISVLALVVTLLQNNSEIVVRLI